MEEAAAGASLRGARESAVGAPAEAATESAARASDAISAAADADADADAAAIPTRASAVGGVGIENILGAPSWSETK